MLKKRKITPAAAGIQLPVSDISTESPSQYLSTLNNLLSTETVERREQIDQLRDELNAIAADLRQTNAVPATSAELPTADLNRMKMDPATMNVDLDVEDLRRSDLDEKMIELTYLKDRLRSSIQAFSPKLTSISAEAERKKEELLRSVTRDMERCVEENINLLVKLMGDVEEMKCRKKKEVEVLNAENKAFALKISALEEEGKKREELLQSVTRDMGLTKICLEEKGALVEKLVRELQEVKIIKEKEVELLTAENTALSSMISAMEDRLRDAVLDDQKEENSTPDKRDMVVEKDLETVLVDELVDLKMQRSRSLGKFDMARGMGAFFQLKIDELRSKMARKNIVGNKRAKYEIRMSGLVEELAKRRSSERRFEDAYRRCNENCELKAAEIGSMLRELKMKADEAVDLKLQVKELMRGMEEMKCRKKKEVELLNAENRTRDVMEEKDLGSALVDELVELEMQRSQLLAKHDIAYHMGENTIRQMDELERKMKSKNIGVKKRVEYNFQMVNLMKELDDHRSAEMRIGADYRSCKEKCEIKAAEIASVQRELKMKADEAVDLRLQLKELMKSKQKFELRPCGLASESAKMRTHIDYLTAEKASLEKHLETSQEELKNVQRTLMDSVKASCSVLSKLKKTAAEAVGHEGAQGSCIRSHPVVEILVIHGGVGGDAEKLSSLARLRREAASSSTGGVGNPYNDAVVIKASIENILVHRVLIDSGSSVNVLYKRAFERMRLDPNTLIPPDRPQFDSFGDRWEAEGIVILPVELGDDRGKYMRMARFYVFDGPDHYNAIFGRPLLNDFQAVVYTHKLTLQFPADGRKVVIRGDVISARECYLRAVGALKDSSQPEEGK